MVKKIKSIRGKQSAKLGMMPGTPVFLGQQKREKTSVDIISYDSNQIDEWIDTNIEKATQLIKDNKILWININGIHDLESILKLGEIFKIHSLTLEDMVNTNSRPKFESFENYIFVVVKIMNFLEATNTVDLDHAGIIIGKNFVISFMENDKSFFDTVRNRLQTSSGRHRFMQADYLAYAILDTIIDHYFVSIEKIGDFIEELDERIITNPQTRDIHDIHKLKRNILTLRKAVWPVREIVGSLDKSESGLVKEMTKIFLRDLYDHSIQVVDMIETYRDILAGLHDTYLSSASIRMNEVMKVLTIISTIFMPLSFIVGVYGMNFQHMPELAWEWGYYWIWAVILLVATAMLYFFRKNRWL